MRPPPPCISAIRTDLTHCTNEPIFAPISALRKASKTRKSWDVKSCESSAAFPQRQVLVGSKYQSQSLGKQNVALTHKKMFGGKKIFVLHLVGKWQDQEGTSPSQPKVPETAQSKRNLLAVNRDQGETEKLPIKNTE